MGRSRVKGKGKDRVKASLLIGPPGSQEQRAPPGLWLHVHLRLHPCLCFLQQRLPARVFTVCAQLMLQLPL